MSYFIKDTIRYQLVWLKNIIAMFLIIILVEDNIDGYGGELVKIINNTNRRNIFTSSLLEWKFDKNKLILSFSDGRSFELTKGETLEDWTLIWVGKALEKSVGLLERNSINSGAYLILFEDDKGYYISKPEFGKFGVKEDNTFYKGHSLEEILASGKDILGQEVLNEGEPSYESIVNILPPIEKKSYAILGSPTTWGKLIVLPNGDILTQPANGESVKVFSPREEYELSSNSSVYNLNVIPLQGLMDEWMPMVLTRFITLNELVEAIYFVVPGETQRNPIARVCISAYLKSDNEIRLKWRKIYSVKFNKDKVEKATPNEDQFYDKFITSIIYWLDFKGKLPLMEVPEEIIYRFFIGSLAQATVVFSGDSPHYGARGYGDECHDHFTPNYISFIETFFLSGDLIRARRVIENFLSYAVDPCGRINYWQGSNEFFAASGSEYGQFLWLMNSIESQLEPKGWIVPYLDTLERMGNYLISRRLPSEEAKGKRLIMLCPEADNADRVYPYIGNNLWVVMGLRSLGDLLKKYGRERSGEEFISKANDLFKDISETLKDNEELTPYGHTIPFRLGYPNVPWTLSYCQVCPEGVEPYLFQTYLNTWSWGQEVSGQDFLENTYANYRYYPEMLSAMLLNSEEADAILTMRYNLGGELLGMCRFADRIDDWPQANYARFLLATDRIERFLLLYYGHMCHHGRRDVLSYYEQVTPDGKVIADDCIPSLLLVPLMTLEMFSFTPPNENALYLCKATPRRWLDINQGFKVEKVMSLYGPISLEIHRIQENIVNIEVDLPYQAQFTNVYLDLRLPNDLIVKKVLSGSSFIEEIMNMNRLKFKKGTFGHLNIEVLVGEGL